MDKFDPSFLQLKRARQNKVEAMSRKFELQAMNRSPKN